MGFRGAAETMSMDGKRRRDCLPGLNETERKKVCYYVVYPSLLLSLHPDYMMIHTLWPRAVDRTEIVCEWQFHPTELAKADFVADDAIEFWDITNREDWHILELSRPAFNRAPTFPAPIPGVRNCSTPLIRPLFNATRDTHVRHSRLSRRTCRYSTSRAAAERSCFFQYSAPS